MMCLNNKHEIEKLQRLQNRLLRLCYNINTPVDISICQLHDNARLDKLCVRRKIALLCTMYDLRQNNKYEKIGSRVTRANDGYVFDVMTPHVGIYANSPYYVGASMWNRLPLDIRNIPIKEHYKRELKNYLGAQY